MTEILDVLITLFALPVLGMSLYLAMLAWMARRSGGPPETAEAQTVPFDIVVPAHNEALGIAGTVQSLLELDYPRELFRVLVVADNCEDATAEKAREAGAEVLVRKDTEKRGKGYALELAFGKSAKKGFAKAVVVVDADTFVSKNLLRVFAAKMAEGAGAMQAHYGVLNPMASWRTRLMTLALALFNDLRSLGRERLGLSTGLKGNGMCFTHALLRTVPHQAYSVVEDLEYGIRLGEAGYRVHYAEEAVVKGEMVSSEKASRSQRRRWEGGRLQMARRYARPLLRRALAERSMMLFDLGFDLLIPPLTYLVVAAFGLTLFTLFGSLVDQGLLLLSTPTMLVADVALLVYVLRGWRLSGVGARGLLDLMWAPVFVVWKLRLLLSRADHPKNAWVRTAREGESRIEPGP